MKYYVEISPRALKDLRKINADNAGLILAKVAALSNGIPGDVKKLTEFEPEYHLRVGSYRVLFDIENDRIIVRRVRHRSRAY